MGLDAVAHGRSHHLGRQIADHVGTVGVAVPAGVQNQLFALGVVLAPQVLPVLAPQQIAAERIRAKASLHGGSRAGLKVSTRFQAAAYELHGSCRRGLGLVLPREATFS